VLTVPVRLIASDLDGTLLRSDDTISARTAAAVAAAEDAGIPFVFVTGRPPRWMDVIGELTGHHGVAICANGAVVYDLRTSTIMETHTLPAETALRLVQELRQAMPEVVFACERGLQFSHEPAFEPRVVIPDTSVGEMRDLLAAPVVKLLVRHVDMTAPELMAATEELFDGFAGLATVTYGSSKTMDGLLEISGPGVTKAFSLERLADEHGVGRDDVIAFGDTPNDIPMLAWASVGVAVANAHPEVLAIADEVTASNDDDGVAIVVERILS
jgi:Cof subfamily protein (haloacid dehalogenase superfamily)